MSKLPPAPQLEADKLPEEPRLGQTYQQKNSHPEKNGPAVSSQSKFFFFFRFMIDSQRSSTDWRCLRIAIVLPN